MLPSWAKTTVTRIRPSVKTVRGSEMADWSNPDELEIPNCYVQPASTSLTQDGRVQGITDGFTCYLPPDSDVAAGDRIKYCGNLYTINGDPQSWTSPTGRVSHIQLQLERWRG